MCKFLKIPRNSFYYKAKSAQIDVDFENAVIEQFKKSRNNYGTRKLRVVLRNLGILASRKRIGKVMKKYDLVSNYTKKHKKKPNKQTRVNNDKIANIVNREFNNRKALEVIVSDLTYVKVGEKWHYICVLVDLYSRKIIGSSVGKEKTAELVGLAFDSVSIDLKKVEIFHTDRGSEFKNRIIEGILSDNMIARSLSAKGTPIDNAVCESIYNVIKTEFVYNSTFNSLDQLELAWFDYKNWYNNHRVHGTLGYATPNSLI